MIRFENTNKRGHHERNIRCALRIPASRLFGKGETGIRARKGGDDSRKVRYANSETIEITQIASFSILRGY